MAEMSPARPPCKTFHPRVKTLGTDQRLPSLSVQRTWETASHKKNNIKKKDFKKKNVEKKNAKKSCTPFFVMNAVITAKVAGRERMSSTFHCDGRAHTVRNVSEVSPLGTSMWMVAVHPSWRSKRKQFLTCIDCIDWPEIPKADAKIMRNNAKKIKIVICNSVM